MTDENKNWGYEGKNGPAYWDCLSEEYALCGSGKQQSPIDITDSIKADLPPLMFNYHPIPLIIENNGHTIQVSADKAGTFKIGENAYQLVQFHFHTPSEEAINGKRTDMVIHLVHQNIQGELAVVAVLLKAGNMANSCIEALWNVMPKTQGEAQHHDVQIDINELLPTGQKDYYSFAGSLTTPPCSEGVKWVILKQTVSISPTQLAQYQAVYTENARPLQPLNDRKVLSSN
ncbi:MAG: carbonic anhydrase family protein [Pseudomonadota bacterium]